VEKASIVTMTYNRSEVLEKTLNAMLKLDYPEDYEIIVVNDGSTDNTREVLEKFGDKIRVIHQKRSGPCAARNAGFEVAKYPIVVNMDDDCIPEKEWLRDLVSGFDSPKIGVVSAFAIFGGTSTAFRKEALAKVGFYDEEYFYYREDTDLVFRILDAGYETKQVDSKFTHLHEYPAGLINGFKQARERVMYHQNDVLLFKKHPERSKEFFDIKYGFLRNPKKDFNVVTNQWAVEDVAKDARPKKKLQLSSPRGIVFLENKTPVHTAVIILIGIGYMLAVKSARLWGSIKYRKLLL
jgi:glycosyltransferase involved in cell wall biosynthesis